ncbi:MAG: tetratricopeptide repeat protein [Chitinophagales bacterium]
MAANEDQEIEQVNDEIVDTRDIWHKTEDWFEENKQKVAIGGGVLAVLIVAVVFIFVKWLPERNKKAQREMFMAEIYFNKDSFDLALNGNMGFKGFLDVQKKYGMTKAANLCNYYIGLCYYNKKDFAKAVSYMNDFSSSDPILSAEKYNVLGDAAAEEKKTDDAVKFYQKAADAANNEQFTPYYLLKLGMFYEYQKKNAEARQVYEKIRDNYPNSQEGRDIEKYLARVANA